MNYIGLFLTVSRYVGRRNIPIVFERGRPITTRDINAAKSKLSINLPGSLIELYRDVGNGMWFRWPSDDRKGPSAVFQLPPISTLVKNYERRKAKMEKWLGFYDVGNGDIFCLDMKVDDPPVVFYQHDWMDGSEWENGVQFGKSLSDFLTKWARVCFQHPSSLWWPSIFCNGKVNWHSRQFDKEFRCSNVWKQ